MKNAMLRVLRVLVIGVLCSLLGHLMAGCDGGINEAGDAGVIAPRPDGAVFCTIPSPTGDQPSVYGAQSRDLPTTNFLLVTNDAAKTCEAFVKDPNSPSYAKSGINCEDPAHDFQGSTGMPWSLEVMPSEDASSCLFLVGTYLPNSNITCGMAPMTKSAKGLYARSIALCGMSGQFVGWMDTEI